MRRLFTILLLVVFLYNTIGFVGVFRALQYLAVQEAQHHLQDAGKLPNTIMILDKNDTRKAIQWVNTDEFIYQGRLYDVLKQQPTANGHTAYYCLNDSKEESLLDALKEHISRYLDTNTPQGKDSQKITPDFSKEYSPTGIAYSYLSFTTKVYFQPYFRCISSVQEEIASPPPKQA